MKKWLFVVCIFFPLLGVFANSTTQKIDEKAKSLEEKMSTEKKLHGKLQDIASEILSEEKSIEQLKTKVEE
nr:peptidase M23 [Campylobacteraceae bacterium]